MGFATVVVGLLMARSGLAHRTVPRRGGTVQEMGMVKRGQLAPIAQLGTQLGADVGADGLIESELDLLHDTGNADLYPLQKLYEEHPGEQILWTDGLLDAQKVSETLHLQ
jgi:hypothetical protein